MASWSSAKKRDEEYFNLIHQAWILIRSPRYFLNAGIAADYAKGDTAAALQYYQKVIDLDGNFAPAYFQRGRMFLRRGELEGRSFRISRKRFC